MGLFCTFSGNIIQNTFASFAYALEAQLGKFSGFNGIFHCMDSIFVSQSDFCKDLAFAHKETVYIFALLFKT